MQNVFNVNTVKVSNSLLLRTYDLVSSLLINPCVSNQRYATAAVIHTSLKTIMMTNAFESTTRLPWITQASVYQP
jgi:hypothetical protein